MKLWIGKGADEMFEETNDDKKDESEDSPDTNNDATNHKDDEYRGVLHWVDGRIPIVVVVVVGRVLSLPSTHKIIGDGGRKGS